MIIEQNGKTKCPTCGGYFKSVSCHWSRSQKCDYPPLSDKQIEIIEGCILGDGGLSRQESRTCYLLVGNQKIDFLKWIYDQLGWLSSSISLHSKEGSEFISPATGKEYTSNNDLYQLRTIAHPQLSKWEEWYDSDKRGKEIKLPFLFTPTTIKLWYAGDGSRNLHGGGDYIKIFMSLSNEVLERIADVFRDWGFPCKTGSNRIRFQKKSSKKLLDWMGDPIPGYEYKWASNLREYKVLKEESSKNHDQIETGVVSGDRPGSLLELPE